MEGRILKGIGGFYYVLCEDQRLYTCRARGIFRKDGLKPLVGDDVCISVQDAEALEGSVDEICPRKNRLIRPEAANVDQALIVFAHASPEPNLGLLDRLLITLKEEELPCILLFNKADLTDGREADEKLHAYENAVSAVLSASARSQDMALLLADMLKGRTTMLAGPSGVGKSTILNRLCPTALAETGEISEKLKRGRHTTRHSELFALEGGGWIMDTPGFTALACEDIEPGELRFYYPEFAPYEGKCRFKDCCHLSEPDCAVRAAVDTKEIPKLRYDNYSLLCKEMKEKR